MRIAMFRAPKSISNRMRFWELFFTSFPKSAVSEFDKLIISEAMVCDSFLAAAAFPVDNDPVGGNNDANGVDLITILAMNPLYACQRLLMVSHKCRYFDGRGANSTGTDAWPPSFSINRFDCKLFIAAFTAETFEEPERYSSV